MARDALMIIHPHFSCASRTSMPHCRSMRHLKKGQEWALRSPMAERILREHNGRDMVYRAQARLARERRGIVFMLDHDSSKWRLDELLLLRRSMGPELAALVLQEVEGMKERLISWFLDNFGEGHLLGINHRNAGPYIRKNFPGFPCNMRIVLMGEYLGCCVDDVGHSLSMTSFSNVHIDEEKCAA